jgi:DNA-binding MarR family transcriptional regulator
MTGMIVGRTASDMPGLDIAEQHSWQNFLEAALRVHATLNRGLTEAHHLTLVDVRLLEMLAHSPAGSARMGDLAEGLMSLPSRVTRQMRRLEAQGMVKRTASLDDGRGVVATITDIGEAALDRAMVTYSTAVREHFINQLSRAQVASIGENCRRISTALKGSAEPAKFSRY